MTGPRFLSYFFTDGHRFKVAEFLTRFGTIEWIVTDAENLDPRFGCPGLPEVIAMKNTRADALAYIGNFLAAEAA